MRSVKVNSNVWDSEHINELAGLSGDPKFYETDAVLILDAVHDTIRSMDPRFLFQREIVIAIGRSTYEAMLHYMRCMYDVLGGSAVCMKEVENEKVRMFIDGRRVVLIDEYEYGQVEIFTRRKSC